MSQREALVVEVKISNQVVGACLNGIEATVSTRIGQQRAVRKHTYRTYRDCLDSNRPTESCTKTYISDLSDLWIPATLDLETDHLAFMWCVMCIKVYKNINVFCLIRLISSPVGRHEKGKYGKQKESSNRTQTDLYLQADRPRSRVESSTKVTNGPIRIVVVTALVFGATTAMAAVCMEDKNACRLRLALASSGELGP